MDKLDTNRNSDQYYGGRIYCSFASREGCLTFRNSHEGNLVYTQTSTWHSEGAVHYFENPVTIQGYNQGSNSLVVGPQIRPCTEHIAIKYHHFCSFIKNGDVEIEHIVGSQKFYEATRF